MSKELSFKEKLANYADLIVSHGLNVQKGQLVNISAEAYHRELAYLVAERAYEVGASYVNLSLSEPRLSRVRIQNSSIEEMNYVPKHLPVKFDELVDAEAANLALTGSEEPDLFDGLDTKKVNTARIAQYTAAKRFYDEGIAKSRVHWTVAAASTPKWAAKVYPELAPDKAEQALWEELFRICRVDRPDYMKVWQEHDETLHRRAAFLTNLKIRTLHFTGPGTDLSVGVPEQARFKGGTGKSSRGAKYSPNLPTEECFTTPDYQKTNGSVVVTRPFLVNGRMIRGLKVEFKNGEIVDFSAEEGAEVFGECISSDPGAKRLGEVALVGTDSPIYQSGRVFELILLDENAACHIAIGSAYKFCIADGDKMSTEELAEIGFNESSVHRDMMISSDEVDVVAKTADGNEVVLIKNGAWVDIA